MTTNEAVDSLVQTRQRIHTKLQHGLLKAQETMKQYADAKREDVSFTPGQWVYVKLKPFRQRSVTGANHSKLPKRFFGPFQITARIGEVAYKLQLPDDSRIHPVFHCSLLRPHYGPPPSNTAPWPLQIVSQRPVPRPLCILDSKFDTSTTPPTRLVLTQWAGQPPEDTTWEPWLDLQEAYHLEDEVVSGGEGIDSNRDPQGEDSSSNLHEPSPEFNSQLNRDEPGPARPTRITHRPTYLNDYIT